MNVVNLANMGVVTLINFFLCKQYIQKQTYKT